MKSGKGGHGKGKGAPSGNRQPPDGGVRQSQTILTYGPGAMVDLLNDAVLVGGLDFWCYKGEEALYGFDEPRLRRHLRKRPGGLNEEAAFRLPPEADEHDPTRWRGIQVLEFPRWFVCQNPDCRRLACLGGPGSDMKDDRYIHRCLPDPKKYAFFTPVRFVVACVNGHIDDFPWGRFVHHADDCQAKTELRLDEGATGDFSELKVTCISCKRSRPLLEATFEESHPACQAKRPWLNDTDPRGCQENMRLLV
ncbi:MAG: hypothetical protein MUF54_09075, partial [Polyangiaceae bacterium]|nr:hypothetical protein [Polyangiaceae bacterium]